MISTLFHGPCSAPVAKTVRQAMRELCQQGLITPVAFEDLSLAATELITNAVHAQATELDVRLTVAGASVELAVHDDAPGVPAARTPGPMSTSGRGLRIVEAIALEWGHRPNASGKTVWARFTR